MRAKKIAFDLKDPKKAAEMLNVRPPRARANRPRHDFALMGS